MWRGTQRARGWQWPALSLVLALITGSACRKSGSLPAGARRGRAPDAGLVHAQLRVGATSFDLSVGAGRALLAWIDAGPADPSLWFARFDTTGAREGQIERRALARAGSDLSVAVTLPGAFALWREGQGATAVARGLWAGEDRDLYFELGPTWDAASAGRGNLALAARGSGALALVRGPAEACGDSSTSPCFGFRFHQLSAQGAREMELPLRVPVPCESQAAALVPLTSTAPEGAAAPRLDYAVCTSAEQTSRLTVFSIEPARSYAQAQHLFEGCAPLGAGLFGGQPSFVAECAGARQLARLRGGDAAPELHALDARGLVCTEHGARVRLGDEWLALDQPTDRLELLLDADLSPPGARAVWTGAALLVARVREGELQLTRFACSGSTLRELERPLGVAIGRNE